MARNRYDVDEVLETPFDFAHLKRSFVYIKKYKGKMITALMLSVFAAISGLLGPLITQYALDNTIPQKNMGQLVLLTLAFVGTIAVSITFSTIRSRDNDSCWSGYNLRYPYRPFQAFAGASI